MRERYALGIDLGGSQIKSGIVSQKGKVKFKKTYPTPVSDGPAQIVKKLQAITAELISFARNHKLSLRGIGIGSPGTVELKNGKVVGASPNIPGWTGLNLKSIFRKFGLPVFADNDANLMALAESRFGSALGYQSAVCLTIGTGIGGGIILDGKVYHGCNSSAGELGHTCIHFQGKPCRCGSCGCMEAYASVPAMLESARTLLKGSNNHSRLRKYQNQLTPLIIFEAAQARDRVARQVIENEIDYLSAGLASVVNLLNPEVIVVGGGLVEANSLFLLKLEKRIKERAFPSAAKELKVVKARLGNQAGFIGAALFCLETIDNR